MQKADLKKRNIKHKNLLSHVKISKEILTFGDVELKEINFTTMKVLFLEDIDIKNLLVSNKISSREKNYKCFIGYLCVDYKIKPYKVRV